jgi:hypothetical protein
MDMCNADKQAFVTELKATQATIKEMTTPVTFTQSVPEFTLTAGLN